MPLVSCKRPREKESHDSAAKRPKTSKPKVFSEFSVLDYKESHWHSLLRSIPESDEELHKILSKYISSLLNGSGGILCFGARKTGMVYGNEISRKEEDNLKLLIDDVMKKFQPIVSPQKYRVSFTPVVRRHQPSLMLLEIRVSPGDPYELYESEFHEVYLRKGAEAYGPLTPHEIKRHTVQQLRKKLQMEAFLHKALDQEDPISPQERRPVVPINNILTSNTAPAQKKDRRKSHPLEETRSAGESGPSNAQNNERRRSLKNVKKEREETRASADSGKSNADPSKLNRYPGRTPGKSDTVPGKLKGGPGRTPGKLKGDPGRTPVKYMSSIKTPFSHSIIPAIIPNTPPVMIIPPLRINIPPLNPQVPPAWTAASNHHVLRNPYQQQHTKRGYYPQPLPRNNYPWSSMSYRYYM